VGSGFYISIYWVNCQAEFTINYYILNLTVITLLNSSPADLLFSSVLLIPICCLVCMLLAVSIIHSSLNWNCCCLHFLSGTSWELNWLHTGSYWTGVVLYSLRVTCTENSASIVEMCLMNHCVATVSVLIT
jgi:hypothetical protein